MLEGLEPQCFYWLRRGVLLGRGGPAALFVLFCANQIDFQRSADYYTYKLVVPSVVLTLLSFITFYSE